MPQRSECDLYRFTPGDAPVLVSVPHAGRKIPADVAARMTPEALRLFDTDWYVDELYAFASSLGTSLLTATHSRYLIDLNRAPDGAALYPGADNTELCPTSTFRWEPIYKDGAIPSQTEIEARRTRYWQPYHDVLRAELGRLREKFGRVVLLEAHSIRSRVPRFFEGRLPHINWGTNHGATAAPQLLDELLHTSGQFPGLEIVANQRFTGGYITRTCGDRAHEVHAVQLEITWNTYIDDEDEPGDRKHLRPGSIAPFLIAVVECAKAWARSAGSVPTAARASRC